MSEILKKQLREICVGRSFREINDYFGIYPDHEQTTQKLQRNRFNAQDWVDKRKLILSTFKRQRNHPKELVLLIDQAVLKAKMHANAANARNAKAKNLNGSKSANNKIAPVPGSQKVKLSDKRKKNELRNEKEYRNFRTNRVVDFTNLLAKFPDQKESRTKTVNISDSKKTSSNRAIKDKDNIAFKSSDWSMVSFRQGKVIYRHRRQDYLFDAPLSVAAFDRLKNSFKDAGYQYNVRIEDGQPVTVTVSSQVYSRIQKAVEEEIESLELNTYLRSDGKLSVDEYCKTGLPAAGKGNLYLAKLMNLQVDTQPVWYIKEYEFFNPAGDQEFSFIFMLRSAQGSYYVVWESTKTNTATYYFKNESGEDAIRCAGKLKQYLLDVTIIKKRQRLLTKEASVVKLLGMPNYLQHNYKDSTDWHWHYTIDLLVR